MKEDCMELVRTAQKIIETGKELSSTIEMFRLCMINEGALKNRLGKILHVDGAELWSCADIKNNGRNEMQDRTRICDCPGQGHLPECGYYE